MTDKTSTYIYDDGAEETVTLSRGRLTPAGHALLKIEHSSGLAADCYVDLAWLRDRADHLARQRPEGAEDIERVILDYKRENAHRGYSEAEIADRIAEEMNR